MEVLILFVPLAIFISFAFLLAFLWASRTGQFDDLESPAHRILYDELER